jgi:hypothetical protein
MISSTLRRLSTVLALGSAFATAALGQSPLAPTWESAREELVNTKHTLYVVTISHPSRRHTCLMQSINASEIVCSNHGHATAYRAEEVAALISPGTHTRWYLYAAGFLAAGGATTWVTVILAPVCVPCAATTGIAAFFLYWMAPMSAMATDDDTADTLLYLAPGQSLKVNLRRAG